MPNQGEAYLIPANDGLFVIHQDSTDIEHEAVEPSQEELIQQLNTKVTQNDAEEVFFNDALRSQLEPFKHRYEIISELAKPRTSRPNYL